MDGWGGGWMEVDGLVGVDGWVVDGWMNRGGWMGGGWMDVLIKKGNIYKKNV